MKLTIGLCTYDDYDGAFFTIQALRMYQNLPKDTQIIVIDNNPTGVHGKELKPFVENWVGGTYVPYTEKQSTSNRNLVFEYADGDYTLCVDSHVLIEQNGVAALLDYYNANPDTKNIITGPLWYDDLVNYSTHFEPTWRDIMYGTWGSNTEEYLKGDPFEIPMMGLGLFSCKTSNWLGFNQHFTGFGGEEGYIHEKFRRNGGKSICIPQLKWNHRFGRPNGIPYKNRMEDRIWNYYIGWLELFGDINHPSIQTITDTFKGRVPDETLTNLLETADYTNKFVCE